MPAAKLLTGGADICGEPVMGIDPGVGGGIAVLDLEGTVKGVTAFNGKMTRVEFVNAVHQAITLLHALGGRVCYLEKVGYKRGDGGKGAFTFGRVVGMIEGTVLSHGLHLYDVFPMIWQSDLECLSGGNKNVTKRRAQELFPEVGKITHATADALLIAAYGWRARVL